MLNDKMAVSKWILHLKYSFLYQQSVRKVPKSQDELLDASDVDDFLRRLFNGFQSQIKVGDVNATHRKKDLLQFKPQHEINQEQLLKLEGFQIDRCSSAVAHGGTGVKVTKGQVPRNKVVALYPGTLYQNYEPLFFQSIGNSFIFRCIDGLFIDGNNKGISKYLYRSCSQRDRLGPYFTSDMSWLTQYPVNPLAIGQYVNNQNKENPANVAYQEFDFPADFDFHLMKYIPNVCYSSWPDGKRKIRTVVLISTRTIEEGEELFSTYFTVVH